MTLPVTAELESTAGDAAAIIESVADLTAAALAPQDTGIPELVRTVTPNGWTENILDLEDYAETPRRKKGRVRFSTTESLARYLVAQRTAGTTLYADGNALTVTAVINDHDDEDAGHRDHRATLTLEKTPAFLRWVGAHEKYLGQEAFAQLIEDGLTEIARPNGATVLEVVQSIHASTNATFRSGNRLRDGQVQFQYVEETQAKAGQTGELEIPEIITLVFEPFFGADKIQIDARLRYRIQEGKLLLGIWLIRHIEEIRAAFEAELLALAENTADGEQDGLQALAGSPE